MWIARLSQFQSAFNLPEIFSNFKNLRPILQAAGSASSIYLWRLSGIVYGVSRK